MNHQLSDFLLWHLSGCVNGEEQLLFILQKHCYKWAKENLSQIQKFGSWVPLFQGRESHNAKHSKAGKTNYISLQDDFVLRTQCLIAKLLDIRPWHVTWHQLTSSEKPKVFETVPPKKGAESILCPLCIHTAARKDWHTEKQDKQIRVCRLCKFRKSHSSRIFSHWHLHCFLFFSLFFTCLACQIST